MIRRFSFFFLILIACPSSAWSAEPEQPLARIAFGSCAQQTRPQPIWESIVAAKPDFFLFIGDTIYADTRDMDQMRSLYTKFGDLPGWQKLLKTCPVMATWDDHDYGENDAGGEYPRKKESQQIFLDFFHEPKDSPRRTQEGVYTAKVFGPVGKRVQIILMDTRYHRSALKKREKPVAGEGPYVANTDPKATFLGETQWKWLEEQLKIPAEVRLLASSIQLIAEDHGYEKWMNMPLERERLYKLLRDTKAAGVIVISGDRHLAELSVMDAGLGYPLYDLTSSGINQASKKWRKLETNRHRIATMNQGDNFGFITIDWDRKDPLIRLQARDVEGEVTIQEKVPLSLLKPGALAPKEFAKLSSGEALDPEEVKKHLDQKVTVLLTVRGTGASGSRMFLNSVEDFRSAENFTVVIDKAGQDAFKKAGVDDPREKFMGKKLKVTGTLAIYRERAEIVVSDPKQIEIQEE